MSKQDDKKHASKVADFIGTNFAFAALVGLLVGLGFKNLPLGLVIGMAAYAAMGAVFKPASRHRSGHQCECCCERCGERREPRRG